MINIFKNSFIYCAISAFCKKIADLWNSSEIGWFCTRNLNDIKTKSSFIYKVLNKPFLGFSKFKTPAKLKELGNKSVLINVFSKYEYFVYATVFLSPFVPTFACLGLVFLSILSYFINRIFIMENDNVHLDAFGLSIFVLLAIFLVCSLTSLAPVSSMKIYLVYLPFIFFTFIMIRTIDSPKKLKIVLSLFVTAGLIVSVYGIYQRFFGNNLGHAWLDDEMFDEITVRVYSTLENPNVLGEYLLLVMPVCAGMIYACKTLWGKLYFGGSFLCCAACMIFTQSRGCWLGLILSAAVFALLVDKRLIILGIFGIIISPFVMPQSIVSRFTSIGNLKDTSSSYRLYIWLGTINMLKDFWQYGIGVGTDAFNEVYPFYSYSTIIAPHAHNIYLQILCETGIAGLLTFLFSMLISIKKCFIGFISDRKGICGITCGCIIAGLLGFLLQGMFDYVWYNYRVFLMFWFYIGIGIAAGRVSRDKNSSCNQ